MSPFVTLSSGRICLRRWRDEDREAFAAMNSVARVMEYFRSRLSRVESDAMVDGIQKHFREHDFGLWAIEVPGIAPFDRVRRIINRTIARPLHAVCGSRLAYATEAAQLALGHGFGTLALSEVASYTSATNHRSRAVM